MWGAMVVCGLAFESNGMRWSRSVRFGVGRERVRSRSRRGGHAFNLEIRGEVR